MPLLHDRISGFVILLGMLCLFVFPACQPMEGTITSPEEGNEISRSLQCTGTLQGLETSTSVWLVIMEQNTDENWLLWPKEQIVAIDAQGHWQQTIFEDGPGKKVALGLWAVPAETQQEIQIWQAQGAKTGHYPPLPVIKGQLLDQVADLTIR